MKKIATITAGSMLFLSLVACSTTPISTEMASPVPLDRILEGGKKLIAPSNDGGTVIVKRDSGLALGGGCTTRIYADGEPIADIDSAEKVTFYLPAGEHIISAQQNGICRDTMAEVTTTVRAGKQSVFRFGISSSGSYAIYPTAF